MQKKNESDINEIHKKVKKQTEESNEMQERERIRDQIEYGRFNSNSSISMIQYMERVVLQCRQHIPIMSDQHLIEKLSRHYNKEIQIAVVNRDITNINKFKILLREYAGRKARVNNETQTASEQHIKKFKQIRQQKHRANKTKSNKLRESCQQEWSCLLYTSRCV